VPVLTATVWPNHRARTESGTPSFSSSELVLCLQSCRRHFGSPAAAAGRPGIMTGHLTRPQVPGPDGAAGLPVWPAVSPGEAVLASALWHGRRCGEVFPVVMNGKRPAVPHGFKSGSRDPIVIANWFEGQYAGCNIGLATGKPGLTDVLDVDNHGDGWAAFNRLKAAGMLTGAVRLVRTPSGGLHAYFTATDQRSGSLPACHLDFKACGGYVLVPPSRVGGRLYEVIDERPWTGAVLDWQAVTVLLRPPDPVPVRAGRGGGSVANLPAWMAQQANGNRNRALYWAACRAAEAGDRGVLDELVGAAVQAGLDQAEALRTVASAARRVAGGG
jgi:Bifunctional DNA primase/polymerase, N-terminal